MAKIASNAREVERLREENARLVEQVRQLRKQVRELKAASAGE